MNFLNNKNLIRIGQNGTDVREVQSALNERGSSLKVDGQFGPKTDSALRSFQGTSKVKTDGIVGPNTRNAFRNEAASSDSTEPSYTNFEKPTVNSDLDRQLSQLNKQFSKTAVAPDRAKTLREMNVNIQGELDALGRVEERQRKIARQDNQAELGSTRALSNRSGTLGSSFGQQAIGDDRAAGKQEQAGIGDDFFLRDQQIRREAMKMAEAQYGNDFTNFRNSAGDLTENAGIAEERRLGNIEKLGASFLSQGIDPMDVDPEELAQIAASMGSSTQDIIDSVNISKKAQLADAETFNLTAGQNRYRINPETGEAEVVASRPKDVKTSSGGSGGSGGSSSSAGSTGTESIPDNELYQAALLTKRIGLTGIAAKEFDRQVEAAKNNPEQLRLFINKQVVDSLPTTKAKEDFTTRGKILNEIGVVESKLFVLDEDLSSYKGDADTGLLKGKLEAMSNGLGEINDPRLADISVNIDFAVEMLARMQTGAAISSEEENRFRKMMPSVNNTGELNQIIISSLRESMQRSNNYDIQSVIGQTGFNAFEGQEQAPAEVAEEEDSFDIFLQNQIDNTEPLVEEDLTDLNF